MTSLAERTEKIIFCGPKKPPELHLQKKTTLCPDVILPQYLWQHNALMIFSLGRII